MIVRLLAVLSCLIACSAQAQSAVLRRPALHWVRGDGALDCVDPRTMAERVEDLVGPVLVRPPEAEHSIEAHVSRVKHSVLRVEVRVLNLWGGKVGERTFEHKGGTCDQLTPAIVFVVAMTIDPDVAAHGLPPALLALLGEEPAEEKLMRELDGMPPPASAAASAPVLEPAPPVVKTVPAPQLPQDRVPTETPRHARHQFAALVRGAWRETARGSLGLELRYLQRIAFDWFSAGGYVRFGQQMGLSSLPNERDRSLTLATFDVGIQACGGQRSDAWLRIVGCVGGEFTAAFARGEGFAPNRLQVLNTGGAVAQLTARMRIWEPFGVMLSLNGRAALEHREFSYENADHAKQVVYRSPIFSGGLALGPTWEF